jgi:hypothetical protein
MTTTDWITDSILLLIVLRQVREERISPRFVLLPLGLLGYFGYTNMTAIPTAGNDLLLIGLCTAVGITLGALGGAFTKVRVRNGAAHVRAGFASVALWIAGMGTRMAFVVWTSHASGQHSIASFSAHHDITSSNAWVDALLLMVICEVVVRLATILVRGQRAVRANKADKPAPRRLPQPVA